MTRHFCRLLGLMTILLAAPTFGATHTDFEETSRAAAHRVPFFLLGGLPDNDDSAHPVSVLVNQAYVVGYSEARQNPLWSAYHVDEVTFRAEGAEADLEMRHDRPDPFYTDLRTAARVDGARTFRRTGQPRYDRGHMTPNDAIQREWGRLAQLETFLMSNVSPQIDRLNSGLWRSLEHRITADLVPARSDVWVVAGPWFGADPDLVEGTAVEIPDGFYMIILEGSYDWHYRRHTYDAVTFAFPNVAEGVVDRRLAEFIVSIDIVEELTRLDFFTDFEDAEEAELEARPGDYDEWFAHHP